MKIGYARVSTKDQDTTAQEESLKAAGCEKIYHEIASGGKWERKELQRMLDMLRPGDVVIVWKLDRLSRSLRDLLSIIDTFAKLDVGFVSLTESVDTTSAAGRMLLQIIGSFGEFERNLIRERTYAGIARAKALGKHLGRPSKLSLEQRAEVLRSIKAGEKSQAEWARLFNVAPSAISRLVAKQS
jgi:DNA invertase Pin-like site-specific DNA recombinase